MKRPTVHLYTVCWDEADMLGFFFRHYDPWVDRYVVYDDGSTDGSRDILSAHPKVELRDFVRSDVESFVLSHKNMQDHAWKESRGRADWVVVTAIDEHLHLLNNSMGDYLSEQADCGVTLVPALGFDLNHVEMPENKGLLIKNVISGRPRIAFNKLSIFKPEAIRETRFGPGRHAAEPIGDLIVPSRDELVLWHYKHLGYERNATRESRQASRLGKTDVAEGYGHQYFWKRQQLRAFWDEMEHESSNLDQIIPDAVCIRPLWWEEIAIPRANPILLKTLAPASPTENATVSVLIKSFNHAAYIRQTIDSILSQSFQDFEIIVTDDCSTDGTAEVVRSFSDPRVHLEVCAVNRGISAAMNATIARARGRYLAILNSDDWALPGRLRRQVDFLEDNPDISLVFGMPRSVDEEGLPTEAIHDFSIPLTFADFSQKTWLRYFFFHGNTLCAPTAMIRREAYDAVEPYDPRFTNIQDLDMWVRMVGAGLNIHVLHDKLTAFRVRDNNANASAPSPEARLRSCYESSKFLWRFADFNKDLISKTFSEEIDIDPNDPAWLQVAKLAKQISRIDYQNFALNLLHERATDPEHMTLLRNWSGEIDVFNVFKIEKMDTSIASYSAERETLSYHINNANTALQTAKGMYEDLLREVNELHAKHAAEKAKLEQDISGLTFHLNTTVASRDKMRSSLSWRSTAPIRWLGRQRRRMFVK